MRITSLSIVLLIFLVSACIADPSTMTFTPNSTPADAYADTSRPDTSRPDTSRPDTSVPDPTDGAVPEDSVDEDTPHEDDISTTALYSSCATLLAAHPDTESGPYIIAPGEGLEVAVYCDMQTDERAGYTMTRLT
ncbi:MAG: fibrinogen-like YCDxxxxGGGW domain-containing protein, partial [Bradymonadaceae bacterium]